MIGDYQQGHLELPVGPPDEMLGNIEPQFWRRVRRIYSLVGRRVRDEIIGQRALDLVSIENAWWDYIEPMQRLLQCANQMVDDEDPNSEHLKPFRLLPLARPSQHSIQLNTTTLWWLYCDAGMDDIDADAFIQSAPEEKWAEGFNLDPATSAGRVFSNSLTTNGVYCSVSVRVPAPAEDQERLQERRAANRLLPAGACQQRRLGRRQQRQQQQRQRQLQVENGRNAQG
jgi:hypothetical protein